jgi:hypothetical protein
VSTTKGDQFSEVVVDHKSDSIKKSELITDPDGNRADSGRSSAESADADEVADIGKLLKRRERRSAGGSDGRAMTTL